MHIEREKVSCFDIPFKERFKSFDPSDAIYNMKNPQDGASSC